MFGSTCHDDPSASRARQCRDTMLWKRLRDFNRQIERLVCCSQFPIRIWHRKQITKPFLNPSCVCVCVFANVARCTHPRPPTTSINHHQRCSIDRISSRNDCFEEGSPPVKCCQREGKIPIIHPTVVLPAFLATATATGEVV